MDAVRESLAQQLTALRAENERLREALESVIKICSYNCPLDASPAIALARAALTSPAAPRP